MSATKRRGHEPAFLPAVPVERDICICTGCRTSDTYLCQAEELDRGAEQRRIKPSQVALEETSRKGKPSLSEIRDFLSSFPCKAELMHRGTD